MQGVFDFRLRFAETFKPHEIYYNVARVLGKEKHVRETLANLWNLLGGLLPWIGGLGAGDLRNAY